MWVIVMAEMKAYRLDLLLDHVFDQVSMDFW